MFNNNLEKFNAGCFEGEKEAGTVDTREFLYIFGSGIFISVCLYVGSCNVGTVLSLMIQSFFLFRIFREWGDILFKNLLLELT